MKAGSESISVPTHSPTHSATTVARRERTAKYCPRMRSGTTSAKMDIEPITVAGCIAAETSARKAAAQMRSGPSRIGMMNGTRPNSIQLSR